MKSKHDWKKEMEKSKLLQDLALKYFTEEYSKIDVVFAAKMWNRLTKIEGNERVLMNITVDEKKRCYLEQIDSFVQGCKEPKFFLSKQFWINPIFHQE